LCGVAFLATAPYRLAQQPGIQSEIGREPFFFTVAKEPGIEHTVPKTEINPLGLRQGMQASPFRKLSLVGFEVEHRSALEHPAGLEGTGRIRLLAITPLKRRRGRIVSGWNMGSRFMGGKPPTAINRMVS